MAQKLFSKDESYITKDLGGSPTALVRNIFVKEDTDPADVVKCGAGGNACGVVDTEYAADTAEKVRVIYSGIALVEVGTGGLTAGGLVASDASGQAVAYAVGDYCLGRAMATAVAGALCPVLLNLGQPIDTIE